MEKDEKFDLLYYSKKNEAELQKRPPVGDNTINKHNQKRLCNKDASNQQIKRNENLAKLL